jgi:hypothetical protein
MTNNKLNCWTSQYEVLENGQWVLAIETFFPLTLDNYDKAKEQVEYNKRMFSHVKHMRSFEVGKAYHPHYK